MKLFTVATLGLCAVGLTAPFGCATTPQSPEGRQDLKAAADQTVERMTARDPSLQDLLDRSAGYAVFPTVGKGGAVVGGAYGRGILYQDGAPIGFVDLSQASVGAQLGGQSYSELIVFQSESALNRVKGGPFNVTADMSAVAVTAGAAASAAFNQGVAIFTIPKAGAMLEVSVGGQKINFVPMG